MRYLLFLLLVVFLSNCTVHKRVHRKGWYIEWHKSYKSDRSSSKEEQKSKLYTEEDEAPQMAQEEPKKASVPTIENTVEESLTEDIPNTDQMEADLSEEPNTTVRNKQLPSEEENVASEEDAENLAKQEARQSKSQRSGNSGSTLLITGAVLLVLGLLALIILVFAVDLGAAILGAVLFAVLGGLGLLFLLIGLIVVLVGG